ISTAPDFQGSPKVAFDGTNFLVVWQDTRDHPSSKIYGARVSPAGTVLDPAGIPLSQGAVDQERPAIAFNGSNFLVAWEDYRSGFNNDVYGTRVSPSGTVLDPAGIAISVAPNSQIAAEVGSSGANFFVTWSDDRAIMYSTDLYGARVSAA